MKVKKHPWKPGIFVGIMQATILQSLSPTATPQSYTVENGPNAGEQRQYHWLDISLKDLNGEVQHGSTMLSHKLLTAKPEGYQAGSKLEVALQLNGDAVGRANVHLPDGTFDVPSFVSSEVAKKFNISLDGVTSNATGETVDETA